MNFYDKNILLIIHHGSLGGAERQGLGLGKILSEHYNCKIYLLLTFSRETTEEFENYAEECHIKEIFHFGQSYLEFRKEITYKNLKRLVWSTKFLLRMRKGLKDCEIDFIFPFLNFPSKVAFYLYKLLPSVKFTFWHQLGLDVFTKDIFEYIAARNIPCVIANSNTGLVLFRECYPLKDKKAFILPQYILMEYIEMQKKLLKKRYGIPEKAIVIGMIAHYRTDKYQELLLDVFASLNEKYEGIHLVLLGNKRNSINTINKFDALKISISQKKISAKVSLLSQVRVEEILNILDTGVLISKIEGMPNTVMEYMLYNLPVVATNHAGCQELLKESPFLIRNNKKQLYNALEKLILSEDLRKMEGKKNQELIKFYTPENYIKELILIMNRFI